MENYGLGLGSKIWSLITSYSQNVLRRTTGIANLLLGFLGIIIFAIVAILSLIGTIIDTVVEIFKGISNIFSSGTSNRDKVIAIDYRGTGQQKDLFIYRPGARVAWAAENLDGDFVKAYESRNGVGGFDLREDRDKVIA
uniref:hypothetical protein n=1 Tax=Aquimarina algiphila TaxID=2047982 RepID=UPI0023312482